jgi:hypothetical protein
MTTSSRSNNPSLKVVLGSQNPNPNNPYDRVKSMSLFNPSGTIAVGQAAIVAGNVVVKAGSGMLCSVLVTTATTAAQQITFVDSATGASGTIIGAIPGGSTVTGVPFVYNFPVVNGVAIQQNAALAAGAITITVN